jgi:transglutaminase-like putative cysteine protease
MRYRLRHTTRYVYGAAVDLAAHMVHLRPRPLPNQRILADSIEARPEPARQRDGVDHFGNRVTWLFIDLSHAEFELVAHSTIDVAFPVPPDAAATPPWEAVAAAAREPEGWQAAEFRFDSPMAPAEATTRAYAAASFAPGRPILSALVELNARIKADFAYRSGMTSISTPVAEVMQRRVGVCQDFTHVMVSALRGLGLPARYVSGYVRTRPPPGQPRRQGADQSHAWVGCWLGPDHGWIDLDPTNALVVHDEHVVVGWGRDYGDVSPIRGVILGGGSHGLTVSVDLEPDEAPPP